MKTISCLITCYNREKFVERAINSVLNQTGNFILEVIVVDDGSTDNSVQVIKQFKGDKIHTFFNPHQGLVPTFVFGIKQCTGDYLCFCDSDDYYLNGKLQRQLFEMEKNPDVGLCGTMSVAENPYTGKRFLYRIPIILGHTTFDGLLMGKFIFTEPTYLIRKSVLDGFDLRILSKFNIQDYPILLYFAFYSKILCLNRPTAVFSVLTDSHSHPRRRTNKLKYLVGLYKIRLYFMFHCHFNPKTFLFVTSDFINQTLGVIVRKPLDYTFGERRPATRKELSFIITDQERRRKAVVTLGGSERINVTH